MNNVFELLKQIPAEQQLTYLKQLVIEAGGDPNKTLRGDGQPCLDCQGTDRMTVGIADQKQKACVFCRHCEPQGVDLISFIEKNTSLDSVNAAKKALDHFGVSYDGPSAVSEPLLDPVSEWCEEKKIDPVAFKQLWKPQPYLRGDTAKELQAFSIRVLDEQGNHSGSHRVYAARCRFDTKNNLFSKGKSSGAAGIAWNRKPEAGSTVYIAEGVKDLTAIHSVLAEQGQDVIVLAFFGSGAFKDGHAGLLQGCDVVFVPDLDKAGLNFVKTISSQLEGFVTGIKVVRLKGKVKDSKGDDFRDCYAKSPESAMNSLLNPVEYNPKTFLVHSSELTRVCTDGVSLYDQTLIAGSHLALINVDGSTDAGRFYTSPTDNELIRIEPSETGSRMVAFKSWHSLSTELSQRLQFFKTVQRGNAAPVEVDVKIDQTHCQTLLTNYTLRPDVPTLNRISHAPSLRSDWSVCSEIGFDEISGTYNDFDHEIDTSSEPTFEDAKDAYDKLCDLFADFNFENDNHRSACIAGILTLLVKDAHEGNQPLLHLDATSAGSGKSLIVDIITKVGTGRQAPSVSYTDCENEQEKRITSLLSSGVSTLAFDNLPNRGVFESAVIDSLITKKYHQSRKLGSNSAGSTLSFKATGLCLFSNGNNTNLGGDIKRRMLISRIHKSTESGLRNYKHGWLGRSDADSKYLEYTEAALTILRAFNAAGRPKDNLPKLDSFEQWHDHVISPIHWVTGGQHNPYDARELLDQKDRTGNRHASLILGLAACYDRFNLGNAAVKLSVVAQRLVQWKNARDENNETAAFDEIDSALGEFYSITSFGKKEPTGESITYCATEFDGRELDGYSLKLSTKSRQQVIKVGRVQNGALSRKSPTFHEIVDAFGDVSQPELPLSDERAF